MAREVNDSTEIGAGFLARGMVLDDPQRKDGGEKLISEENPVNPLTSSLANSFAASRWRKAAGVVSAGVLGLLVACGGSGTTSSSSGGGGTTPPPTSNTIQVNMGDAPADWMLAFSTSVTSMSLNGSNGTVTVSSSPTAMEMMQRMGTMQPFAMLSAPQGTYNSASIAFGNCSVTYIDPVTKTLMNQTIPGPFQATVTFSSPVTLGLTPMAFNFDLDLAHSVTADNSGNLNFSPQFHFSSGMQSAGSGNNPFDGGMQQMMGTISSTASGSFIMTPAQAAQSFTVMTNSSTQFEGIANGMGMMGSGMGVLVTASLQPDGSLLATRVRSRMQSGGIMGGGIVTEVTGTPATQLSLVMQNGAGASMMTAYLSRTITVNIGSGTAFTVDDDRVDLTGLPFTPAFDASHVYAGQSVMPINPSGGMMAGSGMGGGMMGNSAGTMTASQIYLEEQGFRGTASSAIVPGNSTSFTLMLDPQSAFTGLTGATTILVYQQASTNVESSETIASGATLRVHGLLFQNAGQWSLVASTIASE